MLLTLLALLIIIWLFGSVQVVNSLIPNITLFYINSHPITLWNIILLAIILYVLKLLPEPLKQLVFILLSLWILSVIGVFVFAAFFHILIFVVVIWLLLSIIGLIQ